MTTRDDRKEAAHYVLTPQGVTGGVEDWIESGVIDPTYVVDPDVIELATVLERHRVASAAPVERKLAETVAYAMKVDAENEKLKAEPAARTRDAALARLEKQDKDIEELRKHVERQTKIIGTVSEEKRAVEKQLTEVVAADHAALDAAGDACNREADLREQAEAQRDALAAAARNLLAVWRDGPHFPLYGDGMAANDLRTALAESFQPNAQAPEITGESAAGIVPPIASPVATESSVATREKCAACGGSGVYVEEHDLGASEELGCQDCRGTGYADGGPTP